MVGLSLALLIIGLWIPGILIFGLAVAASAIAWCEARTLDGYVAEVQEPERYLNQGSKVMVAPNSRPAMHYWSESDHQFHTVTR